MKKLLLFATASLLLSSCSYKSPINLSDTRLNLSLVEVYGNYAIVQATPDDDCTLYIVDIMKADEFEQALKSVSEAEFQKSRMDHYREHYDQWRSNWTGNTDFFVADVYEHEYYVSSNYGYFIGLEPLTRYCAYGFCVNPNTSMPLGSIQKLEFTTPEYNPVTEGIDFDFMIRDTETCFYYYVRPSMNGRISFDTFFSTVFKDADYNAEPYCGDIRRYLQDWLATMGDEARIFLSIDISRYRTILELEEGEDYTIVGCPYVNLGNGPLTLLHFRYSKGMNTSYGHDSVIDGDAR